MYRCFEVYDSLSGKWLGWFGVQPCVTGQSVTFPDTFSLKNGRKAFKRLYYYILDCPANDSANIQNLSNKESRERHVRILQCAATHKDPVPPLFSIDNQLWQLRSKPTNGREIWNASSAAGLDSWRRPLARP
jgi:hypothetical protein